MNRNTKPPCPLLDKLRLRGLIRVPRWSRKYLFGLLALLGIHQHLSAQQKQDLANAFIYTSPWPVAAGGFKIAGIGTAEILFLLAAVLLLVQLGHAVWKWRRDYRQEQREELKREKEQGGI